MQEQKELGYSNRLIRLLCNNPYILSKDSKYMNKKIIILFSIIIILLGALSIAKSYSESSAGTLKDFFISKLSPEQKTGFEEFSTKTFFDKIRIIKDQNQNEQTKDLSQQIEVDDNGK